MKILVLGTNGQVGRELKLVLRRLASQGTVQFEYVFSERNDLNLAEIDSIIPYLTRVAPNAIINAAAYTAVDRAESENALAFLINCDAVREVSLYCESNMCSLIHISTDYVFDGLGSRPYKEADMVGPSSVYGQSKLAGEDAIRETLDEHIILRTSWVFSAHGSNFVNTMLRLAMVKDQVSVVADQCGAPTSARAIAEAIVSIVRQIKCDPQKRRLWGTYHYSGSPFISWANFAREIFEQAGSRGLITEIPAVYEISSAEYPTAATRPLNSRLDCSKLKTAFGIEPDDWRSSLGFMLDESNPEQLKERG